MHFKSTNYGCHLTRGSLVTLQSGLQLWALTPPTELYEIHPLVMGMKWTEDHLQNSWRQLLWQTSILLQHTVVKLSFLHHKKPKHCFQSTSCQALTIWPIFILDFIRYFVFSMIKHTNQTLPSSCFCFWLPSKYLQRKSTFLTSQRTFLLHICERISGSEKNKT